MSEAVVIRTSAKTCTVTSDTRGVVKKLENQGYIQLENTLLSLVERWLEIITQYLGSRNPNERHK